MIFEDRDFCGPANRILAQTGPIVQPGPLKNDLEQLISYTPMRLAQAFYLACKAAAEAEQRHVSALRAYDELKARLPRPAEEHMLKTMRKGVSSTQIHHSIIPIVTEDKECLWRRQPDWAWALIDTFCANRVFSTRDTKNRVTGFSIHGDLYGVVVLFCASENKLKTATNKVKLHMGRMFEAAGIPFAHHHLNDTTLKQLLSCAKAHKALRGAVTCRELPEPRELGKRRKRPMFYRLRVAIIPGRFHEMYDARGCTVAEIASFFGVDIDRYDARVNGMPIEYSCLIGAYAKELSFCKKVKAV